jgi:integrase
MTPTMLCRASSASPSLRLTGMRLPSLHPRMLRHTYAMTMLDADVDLRNVQIAAVTSAAAERPGVDLVLLCPHGRRYAI